MTVREALRILKEERVLVFAIIALTIVGAVTAGRILPPDRYATAQVQVFEDDHSTALLGLNAAAIPPDHDVLIDTHIRLATSPTIARRVIDRLGLSDTPEAVLERISITALGRSTVLTVKATAPDDAAAVALADTWVAEYTAWRAESAASELETASAALAPRITAAEKRVAEVEARIKAGGHTKASDSALAAATADYELLLAASDRLATLTSLDTPPLTVVSGALAEEHSDIIAIAMDVLKGFAVGLVLAVLVALLKRRPRPATSTD